MIADIELLSALLPGQEPLLVPRLKLIYQPLTKVGCKSLKSWLFILDDFDKYEDNIDEYYAQATDEHYNVDKSFHIHNLASTRYGMFTNGIIRPPTFKVPQEYYSYKKVLFVRNPWDRIASCFVDKAVPANQYWKLANMQNWFKKIDSRPEYFSEDGRFTFEGFLEAVGRVIEDEITEYFDPHWLPQSLTAYTFLDEYDEIGKLETLNEDIERIGSTLDTTVPPVGIVDKVVDRDGNHSEKKTKAGNYESFFLNSDLIKKVEQIYADDIDLFKYTYGQ